MPRLFKPRRRKHGLAPGTPRYVGNKTSTTFHKIGVYEFTADLKQSHKFYTSLNDFLKMELKDDSKYWINIEGLPNEDEILKLGEKFSISKLILEDILNTDHRPKGEELNENVFIILKAPTRLDPHLPPGKPATKKKTDRISASLCFEQISSFLGKNFVLTLQENAENYFEIVANRITKSTTQRVFDLGEDYIFYAQIDFVVDEYFEMVGQLGDIADNLDQSMREVLKGDDIFLVQDLRKDFLQVRRALIPIKEFLQRIIKGEIKGIDPRIKEYLMDATDHTDHLIDIIDSYRELLSGLVEVHLGRINLRTNEVMKVLTLYSSIFIPLTFIVGVYGMNFDNIPEFHWQHGYAFVWGLLILVSGTSFFFFKRKKWI